jgi:hypothetical protein
LASELDLHANSLGDVGTDLGTTTANIRERASWSGSAADSYTDFCQGVVTSIKGLPGPLHSAASAIRAYATTLSAQQQKVEDAVHTANQATGSSAATAQQGAESASSGAATASSGAAKEAADKTEESKNELDKIMEATEPVRKWLEGAHLPWDLGAGLGFEKTFMANAEKAVDFAKDLPELEKEWFGDVSSLAHDAENGLASWADVDDLASRWKAKVNAAEAFGGDLEGAEGILSKLKWVGRGMGVLGLIGDAATIYKPLDSGFMGGVDRGAAVVNAGTTAFSLVASTGTGDALLAGLADANALDEVPVVGEVVMVADVGTGLYLGGDYVYHHWGSIEKGVGTATTAVGHAADDVGHATASVAKSAWHKVSSIL